MEFNLVSKLQSCSILIQNEVPVGLIMYSHVLPVVLSLLISLFVFSKNKNSLSSKLLILISLFFSLWVVADLFTWISSDSRVIMLMWSVLDLFDALFFFFTAYFTYVFIEKRDISRFIKLLFAFVFLPIGIITISDQSVLNFNYDSCEAIENSFLVNYVFFVDLIICGAVFIFLLKKIFHTELAGKKKQYFLLLCGVTLSQIAFFLANNISSYFDNYYISIAGLIGMPIFLAFLGYLIVKFKAFNIKLIGAQALVWALVILIGSEFLFVTSLINRVLVGITLIISSVLGLILVRSVKKEVAQREKIELLAKDLEETNENLASANVRLKELDQQKSEFVSLASHQLRSPLTAIRGYASLITEGEYGELGEGVKEPLSKISDSVKSMIIMVEDFLSVSRIEQGRMKFDFTDFDLKKLAEEVVYELKPNADKVGLALSFHSEPGKKYMVSADQTKIKQTIINFLDNSMKYTPKGSISVSIKKNPYDKIQIAISDTGVGMSAETIPKLFNKFTRAADANKTNVVGTGLGLYVAKKMIEAHKGKVWAESPGEGKGSTFFIELQGK